MTDASLLPTTPLGDKKSPETLFGVPKDDESPRKVNEWRDTFRPFDSTQQLPDVPLVVEIPQDELTVPSMHTSSEPSQHALADKGSFLPSEPLPSGEAHDANQRSDASAPTGDENSRSLHNVRQPQTTPSPPPVARGRSSTRKSSTRKSSTRNSSLPPVSNSPRSGLRKTGGVESALKKLGQEDRKQSRRHSLPPMPTKPVLSKSSSVGSGLNKLGEKDHRKEQQRDCPRQRSVSPGRREEKVESHEASLTMKQTLVQSLNSRASFHFRAGEYKEALRVFKDALRVARSDYAQCTSIKEEGDNADDEDDDVTNVVTSESVTSHATEEQSVIILVKTLNSIAMVHWRLGNLESSGHVLDDAEDVLDATERGRVARRGSTPRPTHSGKRPNLLRDRSLEDLLSQPSARPFSLSFQLVKSETSINRAIVQYLEKDYESAVATLQSTLARQRSALGVKGLSHPLVAQTMDILATTYAQCGHVQESIKLHRDALKMKKASRGTDGGLSVARTLLSLGHRHYVQQDYGMALAAYVEALRVQRKALDPKDADLGVTLHYIGRAEASMGLYKDARANLMEAMSIYSEAGLDGNHLVISSLLHDIDGVEEKLQHTQ